MVFEKTLRGFGRFFGDFLWFWGDFRGFGGVGVICLRVFGRVRGMIFRGILGGWCLVWCCLDMGGFLGDFW